MTTPLSLPRVDLESTREDRALELYAGLGRFIKELEPGVFEVPSQDGRRTYTVRYGGLIETCTCPDYEYRGATCVHLLAVGILHATRRRRRRHTFECSSCASRLPLRQAVVVHEEQAGFSEFNEGELLCGDCARRGGVR